MSKIQLVLFSLSLACIFSCSTTDDKKEENRDSTEQIMSDFQQVTGNRNDASAAPDSIITNIAGVYKGTIDKSKVVVQLEQNGSYIIGKYYYDTNKQELLLEGKLEENGTITLYDFTPSGKHTGVFNAFFENEKINGNMEINEIKTSFSFAKSGTTYPDFKESSITKKVTNIDFKSFIHRFAEVELPFKYEYTSFKEVPMPLKDVRTFIDKEYNVPDVGMETYHYEFAFAKEEFIAVVYSYVYIPGVAGVQNISYFLSIYNFKGEQISNITLGDSGFDSNMGGEEIISYSCKFTIDKELKIVVKQISETRNTTKAEIIGDSQKTIYYQINSEGKINQISKGKKNF